MFQQQQKNKTELKIYDKMCNEILEHVVLMINDSVFYSRDFMKIKFKTDNYLRCNKIINISVCVLVIVNIFKDNNIY